MVQPALQQWRERHDEHPLHRALGIRAEAMSQGFTQMRVVPTASAGGVDGADGNARRADAGVTSFAITTAADVALVNAVGTTVRGTRDTMNGTAELNLTYVRRPAGEATVRATVLHRGRTECVVEVRVTDESGAAVAFGRGTYSLRPGTAEAR